MQLFDILIIAFALAMDAAAVSLVASASGFAENKRAVFRLSFHFGLFQFIMPLIGWLMGISFVSYIASIDHWIAFILLSFVGFHMIAESKKNDTEVPQKDPSKGMTMVLLSVATSIDALAIGLSLAMLDVDIWYASVVIGIITAGLSLIAIRLGKSVGKIIGDKMEVIGGVVLIVIGSKILIEHL